MMKGRSFLGLDLSNGSGSHTLVFGLLVFYFCQSASLVRFLIASASCAKGLKARGTLLRSSLGLLAPKFCFVLEVVVSEELSGGLSGSSPLPSSPPLPPGTRVSGHLSP